MAVLLSLMVQFSIPEIGWCCGCLLAISGLFFSFKLILESLEVSLRNDDDFLVAVEAEESLYVPDVYLAFFGVDMTWIFCG